MKNKIEIQWAAFGLLIVAALIVTAVLLGAAGGAFASVEDHLPVVQVEFPNLGGNSAKTVPTNLTVGILGADADAAGALPWKFRTLWVPAETPSGDPIQIRSVYEQYMDELIRWDDARWSEWLEYPQDGSTPQLNFDGLEDGSNWLLAAQVMDHNGAVSLERGYQREVANFHVNAIAYVPVVVLQEEYLGAAPNPYPSDQVAVGQPLTFFWYADASAYNGTIVSYRHGWDLIDSEDPMDPGWSVPAGTEPQNLISTERTFSAGGLHYFHLRVEDNSGTVLIYRWSLDVVPYVPYEMQRPLVFIDQVIDDNSNRWLDESGNPRDHEVYRDAFWQFLEGQDGASGFDWDRDRFGQNQVVRYEDLVGYRVVLCNARLHTEQLMLSQFRAENDVDRYVWLHAYQNGGGNLMLVGDSSLDSFIEVKPNYWVPHVFDSTQPPVMGYETSFGLATRPDGSVIARGPRMYPSATVGIETLDWSTNASKTAYGRQVRLDQDRKAECAALKGVVLDSSFRTRHGISGAVLADTLLGDALIDWQDQADEAAATLELNSSVFPFRNDEFVDADISSRGVTVNPQTCAGAPNDECIEPMYRGISRMDYIRQYKWAQGDTGWPLSQHTAAELQDDLCGPLALTDYEGHALASAKTNAQTYGFLSYKTAGAKPSGKADVYWGFDPYRFDHEKSMQAVRWALDYFGLQLNP